MGRLLLVATGLCPAETNTYAFIPSSYKSCLMSNEQEENT